MVKRTIYLQRIMPFIDSEMIKVLTGVRRCGKSTLMKQIICELNGLNVEDERIIYINFEEFKYRNIQEPEALYDYIEQRIAGNEKYYLFIDEIQNVNGFELVINSFRSTHDISIFITGSNSKLLSGELATHLAGRTISFRIMPFNFYEFCQFKKESGDDRSNDVLLTEYMNWGGFPLVCKESTDSTKAVVLSNIFDSVVLKDIIMRNKIASPIALERVIEYIIANTSLTISGNKIAAELEKGKHAVSAPTVYDYLRLITEACICDKVSRFDIRGKKALSKEEKMYVCDLGFFRLNMNRLKDEYNYIIETICYNELIARGYHVFIGKTYSGEVDFIAEKDQERFYVQATYMLSDESIVDREFGAYANIKDNYPKYVISLDKYTVNKDGIIHMNLIDWLLDWDETGLKS